MRLRLTQYIQIKVLVRDPCVIAGNTGVPSCIQHLSLEDLQLQPV